MPLLASLSSSSLMRSASLRICRSVGVGLPENVDANSALMVVSSKASRTEAAEGLPSVFFSSGCNIAIASLTLNP